jgi:O-antigen/teichoic acid export membrane protein
LTAPAATTPAGAAGAAGTAGLQSPALSARSLRRGGALYAGSHFLGMGLGFLSSILMVRVAGRSDVASYLLLLQATVAVALVFELGLGQAALRFAPVCRGVGGAAATRLLRRRLLGLEVAVWWIVGPLLYFAWPTIARRLEAPELAGAAPFLLATAMVGALGRIADSYLRAFRFYTSSAFLTHLFPRLLICAGFLALFLAHARGSSWATLVGIFLGAQLLTALAYAGRLTATTAGETSEPRAAAPPPATREILTTTFAMGLRSAASVLMISSDLWILSWARNHEEVAVYGVVTRIVQVMGALPLVANFLIPQEFAILYADGRKAELERLARTAATAVGILSLCALAGIALFGRALLGFAFGDAYVSGWAILLILAVGSFWDAASGSAGYVLQMTGNHFTLLFLSLGGAAFNALLNLAFARLWGGYGVATATAITLIGLNVAMVAAARRKVGVKTFVYFRLAEWRRVLALLLPWRQGNA